MVRKKAPPPSPATARTTRQPIFREFGWLEPWKIYQHILAAEPDTLSLFLDSARQENHLGRYSYIAFSPFQVIVSKDQTTFINDHPRSGNPLDILDQELAKFTLQNIEGLPPFQGGTAGYIGYDTARHLEHLPAKLPDTLQAPDMMVGFYDVVLAFDLAAQQSWVIASGLPEMREHKWQEHAAQRLANTLRLIQDAAKDQKMQGRTPRQPSLDGWRPEISENRYHRRVQNIVNDIYQGVLSQCNFTQRWQAALPYQYHLPALYDVLRRQNPAPFAAYLHSPQIRLLSASPECFLRLESGLLESRPIKGTAKRVADPAQDQEAARALETSEKDRAENAMIVDLLRNDFSKVCQDHSITVPQLNGLESYASVHHLVSVVHGKLKPEHSQVAAFKACFPGGSITGTPKVKAMALIEQYESSRRGVFYGNLGYFGFNGQMQTNILIRTLAATDKTISLQVGGGIVADSLPHLEYAEMLAKAAALFEAGAAQQEAA